MKKISVFASTLRRAQKVLADSGRKDLAEVIGAELNKGATGTPKKAMNSNVATDTKSVKEAKEKMAINNDKIKIKNSKTPKSKTEKEMKKKAKTSDRKVKKGKKGSIEKQFSARKRTPYKK